MTEPRKWSEVLEREAGRERMLEAEWQGGALMRWVFQLPTRVDGFEVEEPIGGELLLVQVAQLVQRERIVLISAVEFYSFGVIQLSPARGWKLGPLNLQTVEVGAYLSVKTFAFRGRLRPFGCQAGGGPADDGTIGLAK